jgi:hypothetical protein
MAGTEWISAEWRDGKLVRLPETKVIHTAVYGGEVIRLPTRTEVDERIRELKALEMLRANG